MEMKVAEGDGTPVVPDSALYEPPKINVSLAELVKLCAVDSELFGHTFFPRAARQRAPAFHREIDAILDDPRSRLVHLRCFRGSAKTTKLRIFTAKRIAYGISRTILYVGASEGHAIRSIQWLRTQLEPRRGADGSPQPTFFAGTFGLRPGRKWTDTEIEVICEVPGLPAQTAWVLGVGITGNIRGINFDDYRPDLIVLDDIVTDESAATKEQREKIIDLVYGSLINSLTPATEEPNAKLALLQTPINPEDVSAVAGSDPQFTTRTFGCWTPETADLPVSEQRSAWEERYPTKALRDEKLAAIRINKLSTFVREKECRLTSPEVAEFRSEWLKFHDGNVPPGITVLAIDPVPPPSPRELAMGLKGKDYEAQVVWRRCRSGYYMLDCAVNRGHDPSWSIATAFSLGLRWGIARLVVESIAYQRVLKWLLEQEMKRRGVYWMVSDRTGDKRDKFSRITTTFAGPASHGQIWVRPEHSEFVSQFTQYGGPLDHDDVIDASASAVSDLTNPYVEMGQGEWAEEWDDANIPRVRRRMGCP
jgi:phage terminase large subunit-like protein